MSETDQPYKEFLTMAVEIAHLKSASAIFEWDLSTYIPEGASEGRARVMATIEGVAHDKTVSSKYEDVILELLEQVNRGNLGGSRAAAVRKAWKHVDRQKRLPGDFVRELADLTASSYNVWVKAKKESDWESFRPNLVRIVEMMRRKAELIGYGGSPYDALLDEYDPGTTAADLDRVFPPLREFLAGFVAKLADSPTPPDPRWRQVSAPVKTQDLLCRRVAEMIGFDFKAGRLDVTEHPFCATLHPGDVRLTTNYKENDFLDALYSTIHETGHGMYEQSLPVEFYGTPVGDAASYGFHEAQSRMWENIVGRSRPFWEFFLPRLQHHAGLLGEATVDDVYRAVNIVNPSLIRIEADEVTYNLHVCLRYEIERGLMEGTIDPEDLPEIWNAKMREYLGVEVPDDGHGVLQDVHWSYGLFGYFPSYALGNLYSAQLFERARRDIPGLEDGFRDGHFRPLLDWLTENLYRTGGEFDAPELVVRATGEAPTAYYFMAYVKRKFGEIYRL